jgi:hypothetical protein
LTTQDGIYSTAFHARKKRGNGISRLDDAHLPPTRRA